MSTPITRREFAATAAAGLLGAPAFLRARDSISKMNIAMIACGGRGAANMKGVSSEYVTALCDVNADAVRAAADKHPDAQTFTDFRTLLDNAKSIDAGRGTPCWHQHVPATP